GSSAGADVLFTWYLTISTAIEIFVDRFSAYGRARQSSANVCPATSPRHLCSSARRTFR
ncbi:hypothetical protein L227DRAFT_608811, partial [Lentinus tigrinus ALCF2SS1-6]